MKPITWLSINRRETQAAGLLQGWVVTANVIKTGDRCICVTPDYKVDQSIRSDMALR
jgi:hypothetical protein